MWSFMARQSDEKKSTDEKKTVNTFRLPYLNEKIDLNSIQANGLLLTDEQLQKAIRYFANADKKLSDSEYVSKKELGIPFSVVRVGVEIYAVAEPLGEGQFGKVRIAQQISGSEVGKWVALKKIKLVGSNVIYSRSVLENIANTEQEKLQTLGEGISGYAANDKHGILMQLAAGVNLSKFNDLDIHLPPAQRVQAAKAMVQEIENLHNQGFFHLDIKGDNIHFDRFTGKVAVIDFGFAQEVKDSVVELPEAKGSPMYMAPEIFTNQKIREGEKKENIYTCTAKTEVFALGITLAQWFGYAVNRGYDKTDYLLRIMNKIKVGIKPVESIDKKNKPEQYLPDKRVRDKVLHLIQRMIDLDPDCRPTLSEAKNQFEMICKDLQRLSIGVMKVGLVNMDELDFSEDNTIETLKCFDQIWLMTENQAKRDQKAYLELIRKLMKSGINIRQTAFACADMDALVKSLPALKENKELGYCYYCFYVTKKPDQMFDEGVVCVSPTITPDELGKKFLERLKICQVDDRSLEVVVGALREEIERLSIEYAYTPSQIAEDRKNEILSAISVLSKRTRAGDLTYQQMLDELDTLKNKMSHTNHYLRHVPTIFAPETQGSKKVAETVNVLAKSLISSTKNSPCGGI